MGERLQVKYPHLRASGALFVVVTQGRTGPLVALSRREADIVRLVAGNLQPAEIAAQLRLTEKTVSGYIWRLCQGLGLSSRHELMIWGWQNQQAIGPERKPARAGLHPLDCVCGAPPCSLAQLLRVLPDAA